MAAAAETAEPATNATRIKGEEVSYESDGVTFKGYIAWNEDQTGERPGILAVHEWWGHDGQPSVPSGLGPELTT